MKKQLHILQPHHHAHLSSIGVPWLRPPHVRCTEEEYSEAYNAWKRSHPHAEHQWLHTKALGHLAWQQHQEQEQAAAKQPVRHVDHRLELRIVAGILLALVILLLAPHAHCQFSHINTISTCTGGNCTGGNAIGFHASPLRIICSTNTACTDDGYSFTITASSTAATAWSAITAATNVNVGIFAMSGNTLDLTAATLVKLRVAGGLTTSVNGDCGYDSTAKVWHCWQNGADRLMIMATNLGASGQPLMSNADGSGTFADPIVSGATAIAAAPSTNPVFVGTWDGTNIRVPLTQNGTPGASDYGLTVRNIPTGTQAVSGTFWQATQPVSGTFWQATQPVSGTFWQATQPVSGTFFQATQPVSTADGAQVTLGAKADAKSTATDVTAVTIMQVLKEISAMAQAPASTPVTGTFWQATQPVSGTVTANQGGTWTVQPGNTANTTAWKVDGSAVTQPVSGTVTANAGTNLNTSALALDSTVAKDATLTGGTAKAIMRGGAKGTTVATDVTSSASGVNHQPVDVAIYDASGNQITSFGGGTQYAAGTTQATPTGTVAMGQNPSNVINPVALDASNNLNVNCQSGCTSVSPSATFVAGQLSVSSAAQALPSASAKNVCVHAANGNGFSIYVGASGVTLQTGSELGPGDRVCWPVANANLISVIGAASGASLDYTVTN